MRNSERISLALKEAVTARAHDTLNMNQGDLLYQPTTGELMLKEFDEDLQVQWSSTKGKKEKRAVKKAKWKRRLACFISFGILKAN